MGWEIVNETGVAPKIVCLKYTKRGVTYYLSYGVYWDSTNKIHYFNPYKPFSLSARGKRINFSEEEFYNFLKTKNIPIPQLPYKPQN
ncbi:MAG: hypothetical protein QXO99_08415 [Candidatus Methanomethylicia archaeon]